MMELSHDFHALLHALKGLGRGLGATRLTITAGRGEMA